MPFRPGRQYAGRYAPDRGPHRGVHGGDTITLLDAEHRQHNIRLDGIDAPELGKPFGRASKLHLAELLANLGAVTECNKIDRYRREVCRVLVGGVDAGLEQAQSGMAWYFRRYAKELTRGQRQQHVDAEVLAQTERRGLWADAKPVPPWDWRAERNNRQSHYIIYLPAYVLSKNRIYVPDYLFGVAGAVVLSMSSLIHLAA